MVGDHGSGSRGGQREAQRAQADAHDIQAVVAVMQFLRGGEGTWRAQPSGQEQPPMPLELLHRAEGPAVPLTPVALEGLRDEAAAVGLGEVHGLVANGVNTDRQLGVFGQAPFGPAACPFQGGAPDQRHSADGDPGPVLIQAHHAGGEEDGVLPVRPPAKRGLGVAAVGVRALHEPHGRIGEVPGGVPQPVPADLVVGVHHGDQLRPRAGVAHRPVQRACLGAGDPLDMKEPEPRAEPLAVRLDRQPQLGVGGVVVDDQDLKVGVIECGQAVQRTDHDVRRLGMTGHMHRNPGRIPARPRHRRPAHPAPAADQQRLPALTGLHHRAGQRDRRQRRRRPQQRQRHPAHVQVGEERHPPAQQGGAEQHPARPRRRAHRMQPPAQEPVATSHDHHNLSGPHRGSHMPRHQRGIKRAAGTRPAHRGEHGKRRARMRPARQADQRHHMRHGKNDQGSTQATKHPGRPSRSARQQRSPKRTGTPRRYMAMVRSPEVRRRRTRRCRRWPSRTGLPSATGGSVAGRRL